jgi:formate hydrogenlyase transcriptional activator
MGIPFNTIVGRSPALLYVLRQIEAAAPTDTTVLITGETGTGKELFARFIHKMSVRSGRAFVSVDCSALASMLDRAEPHSDESVAKQFWSERFESACAGTIFLDQISEIPPEGQAALLAVMEERELERDECAQLARMDVRIVAATNHSVGTEMEDGRFRSDLFYRLNVFPIELPPLRARRDDIRMLTEYFVKYFACRLNKNLPSIDERTLKLFQSYDWPGNIRELQNIVERSVIVTDGEVLSVDEAWFHQQPLELPGRTDSPLASIGSSGKVPALVDAALAKCRAHILDPPVDEDKPVPASMTREGKVNGFKTGKSRVRYLN